MPEFSNVNYSNLPVVTNIDKEVIFPDGDGKTNSVTHNLFWYLPNYEIVNPNEDEHPSSSPFLFTFERTGGVTVSGNPGLKGTIRFTLRTVKDEQVQAAIDSLNLNNVEIKQIPASNTSISLSIPFIDNNDGYMKRHEISGNIKEVADTLIITIEVYNEWVQLCYGVLSLSAYQRGEMAKLVIDYKFDAYKPVSIIETFQPIYTDVYSSELMRRIIENRSTGGPIGPGEIGGSGSISR